VLHRVRSVLHSENLHNLRHQRSISIHEHQTTSPVIPSKCEESHYQEDLEGVRGS